MVSQNPFAEFRKECEAVLEKALKKTFPEVIVVDLELEKPPNIEFGQLASSLCFELAKQFAEKPIALAERVVKAVDKSKFSMIERIVPAGGGYINFHANFAKLSASKIKSA